MEKEVKLLPCPFCGGEPTIGKSSESWQATYPCPWDKRGNTVTEYAYYYKVKCKECDTEKVARYGYLDKPEEKAKEEVIEAWNKRK